MWICRPKYLQEAVYSGHKKYHAIKYQYVMCPNGLIAHLYGPYPGRRHDAAMFRESKIEDLLCQIFNGQGQQMAIYGDAAYPLHPYMLSPYSGVNRSAQQLAFNSAMSPLRCSVEWGFGKIVAIFAFLDFHKNQKLYLQPLGPYFQIAGILANCCMYLYRSEVAQYFGLVPPTLEEYLH